MVSLDLHRPMSAAASLAAAVPVDGDDDVRVALTLVLSRLVADLPLLLAEISCPRLLDGPVSVTADPDPVNPDRADSDHADPDHAGAATLHVRQLPFASSSLLSGGQLLLVSTQQAPLLAAGALPSLVAGLVEAERARVRAEHAAQAALQMANIDTLSGLGNRRAWLQALQQECSRETRQQASLAVVVLDIDGLKAVNDLGGHAAGDELISRTARVLSRTGRTTDIVCRLGGDEFGIAAPATDAEQARLLVDRITAELAMEGVSASVGVAVTVGCAGGPDELWKQADAAMYDVKRARTRR